MENLGQNIRNERYKRKLTLEQVAEKTSLSKSFLSNVERGLSQPSISSIMKIAKTFGMSVVDLFQDSTQPVGPVEDTSQANNLNEANYVSDIQVVRANERKIMGFPGSNVVYNLITPDLNRRLQILYLKTEAGGRSGDKPIGSDPKGEKCVLLLKGKIEMTLGQEVFLLQEGDSIYYPANIPISWRGMGSVPIEIILVITPPWF